MAKWDERYAGSSCTSTSRSGTRRAGATSFEGDEELGPVALQRRLPLVPRRLDGAHPRAFRVLRALLVVLQALRRGSFAPTGDRVELRQPHRRLPHRRPRPVAAHRVPHPGRGREPVPRLRRGARGGARRDRSSGSSRRRSSRATSTRPRAAAGAAHAARGDRALSRRARSRARRSARTSSSTTCTSSGPSSASSTRSSRAGSARASSREAEVDEWACDSGQGGAHHGRGGGIGRETALLFAREGAQGRRRRCQRRGRARRRRRDRERRRRGHLRAADVSKRRRRRGMVAAAEERFGRLDVLFNNAGIFHARRRVGQRRPTRRSGTSS